ncbi:PREDICTED: uncharacterized protein LOC103341794 [Prunus mume]|uniref:Uncharacterized protein LOC103341794 n=1 Tax=Prunus mume TaxID=102107 RepID=A0ABM0PRY9_PRUMU|nr:PREDICTED: uncharacterized protein LOC103341794 [Prunus mume]
MSGSCFNGVLRRLLCSGSVPTHPTDQIAEPYTTQLTLLPGKPNPDLKIQSSASSVTPGIVARLMGLDSLPETNWVSKGRAPDLVSRSRSVSFADYLMDFDLADQDRQHHHRRVRTSVSFREVPAALNHQKSPDFLLVYLDNVDKSKEIGSKVKKSEMGFGELKQGKKEQSSRNKENSKRESDEIMKQKKKKEKMVNIKQNKKISKLKDEPRRECGAQSSKSKGLGYSVSPNKKTSYKNGGAANFKESSDRHQLKKTTQKKKVVEEPRIKKTNHQHAFAKEKEAAGFHGLENTSPVSVLCIDDMLIQHEAWISGYSMPMDLNSNMKSSPKAPYIADPEVRTARRKDFEPIKDEDTRDYAELLASKIQRWTEEDLKESNWVAKNVSGFEGYEEICLGFEGLILDMLLQQAIDEFV